MSFFSKFDPNVKLPPLIKVLTSKIFPSYKKSRKSIKKSKILKKRSIKPKKRFIKKNKAKKQYRSKKTQKKSPKRRAKKTISPKEARRILGNVGPQYCLWIMNGAILKNLNELARELERMSTQVFRYHVSKERNDFSRWIDEIFNDKKLARDIKKAKTKKQAYKILKSRINKLKSIIARSKLENM